MSRPGPGAVYRNCIMCGVPFRVWKCETVPNRGNFCSRGCYYESRRAFSQGLTDGRLEALFAPEREEARRKRAAWRMTDYMARKLADRTDWRTL
jgi:hypothetical protein